MQRQMQMRRGIVLMWWCLLAAMPASAQAAIDVLHLSGQEAWPLSLAPALRMLEDPAGTLTAEAARQLPEQPGPDAPPQAFHPAQAVDLDAGFTSSALWLSLRLANDGPRSLQLVLAPGTATLQRVDYYLLRGDDWSSHAAGAGVATPAGNATRLPTLSLELQPGEQLRVLARVRSASAIQLRPQLFDAQAFTASEQRMLLWDGLLLGGLLAGTFCVLLYCALSRNSSLLLLGGICLLIALHEASQRGYTKWLLWPQSDAFAARAVFAFGGLAVVLAVAYIHVLARRQKMRFPGGRVLLALALAQALAMGVAMLLGPDIAARISAYGSTAIGLGLLASALAFLRGKPYGGKLVVATAVFLGLQALLRLTEMSGRTHLLSTDLEAHPVFALMGLFFLLSMGVGWIYLLGRQRQQAHAELLDFQLSEQERLRDEVARQTQALHQSLEETRKAHEEQTRTLAYVGHDLRAPLVTVSGHARRLLELVPPELLPGVRAIERSAQYQLSLIDELVNFARDELQSLRIQPVATDMWQLLQDIQQYASVLALQQHNRFTLDAAPGLPATLQVDSRRLQQVLLNLITNAAKFTRNGSIQAQVRGERLDDQGRWRLHFCISDSGIGIEAQDQSRIFNAFEQLQPSPGSVGLGLFIARRIVQAMGGELRLRSASGQGSAFFFELEAQAPNGELAAPQPPTIPMAPRPLPAFTRLPSEEARAELAQLAREGQLTALEDWTLRLSDQHPEHRDFCNAVLAALEELDFERVQALAAAS
ncbi:ATP-binding protein [Xylophilus sp. GW821-FHT01B05]